MSRSLFVAAICIEERKKKYINSMSFTVLTAADGSIVLVSMYILTVSLSILDRFSQTILLKSLYGLNLPPGFFANHIVPAVV